LLRNPEAYVRVWFDSSCKAETRPSEAEIAEIVTEFSYPGIAEAVPRYFRDIRKSAPVDYSRFTMPVLYVHGEHDPRQPIEYAQGMEEHVPRAGSDPRAGLRALRHPRAAVRARPGNDVFLSRDARAGSAALRPVASPRLPVMPTRPLPLWGVNAARLDSRPPRD
jgi:hypothetical protein